MKQSSQYVLEWLSDSSSVSKVAISAKIPSPLELRLNQLADIVGTSKTEVIIAALDIGESKLRDEYLSATGVSMGLSTSPCSLEEFQSLNPTLSDEELDDCYDMYLRNHPSNSNS